MIILTHADASIANLAEMSNTSQCPEYAQIIHVNWLSNNNSIDIIHIQGLLLSQ